MTNFEKLGNVQDVYSMNRLGIKEWQEIFEICLFKYECIIKFLLYQRNLVSSAFL
jgi:hypothetical protein